MGTRDGEPRSTRIWLRFADQGVVSIGNFALGALSARILGPEHFGAFALLWTIISFGISAQWAFIISPMQSSVPRLPISDLSEFNGALLSHSLAIAAVSAIVAVLVWAVSTREVFSLYGAALVASSFVAVILQDYARRWLLVTERAGAALVSDSIRHVGFVVVILYLWRSEPSLVSTVGVIGVSSVFGCLSSMTVFRESRWKAGSFARFTQHHAESGLLLVPFVGIQAGIAAAPIYVLSAFVSAAAAGGYRVATSLIAPIIIVTEALETFLPLRASESIYQPLVLRRLLNTWRVASIAISGTYATCLAISGHWVVTAVFGESYDRYVPLLYPLLLSGLLQNFGYIRNVELRAQSSLRKIFGAEIAAALALGAMYLVMSFGQNGEGLAIAALASQAVKLVFLLR